jgi:signal transduction histidine kinase
MAAEAAVREAEGARDRAERERWQAAFLSEASRLLAASLDYDATLDALVRLLVPTLADWAVVHLARRDGGLRRIGPAYADPTLAPLAAAARRVTPPIERGVSTSAAAVVRDGQPLLVTEISREWLERTVRDPEYLAFVLRLDPHSLLTVPLVARGRTLGALTLVALKRGRRYGEADLIFAEEVGRRMGLAVDNVRLYRHVERAKADAEDANRAKDEFFAVLSHELRTPLNAVSGWIQLLGERTLQGVAAERAIDTVRHNVSVLRRLSEDLLDVSAIIAGKLTLDVMPCELAPVIEETVKSFRRDAEAGGVVVSAALEPGLIVNADVVRLRQVIGNLLSNAIKFTPHDGRVGVTLTRAAARARIVVSDTGPGIPQGALSRVFDRFWQADRSGASAPGGLGLGLAIVKHLVELHGGTVRAENRADGRGAAFTVELPTVA